MTRALHVLLNLSALTKYQGTIGKLGLAALLRLASHTPRSLQAEDLQGFASAVVANLERHSENRTRIYKLKLKLMAQGDTEPRDSNAAQPQVMSEQTTLKSTRFEEWLKQAFPPSALSNKTRLKSARLSAPTRAAPKSGPSDLKRKMATGGAWWDQQRVGRASLASPSPRGAAPHAPTTMIGSAALR